MSSSNHYQEKYGPWAVVTGASDGIGREIALRLAEAGLNLVLVARRARLLGELGERLREERAIEVRVVAVDLERDAGWKAVCEKTADLDVGLLAACAGYGRSGPLVSADLEQELGMVDVNCRAVLGMAHEFGRRFAERGRGGMILMSSLLAFQGVPRAANYAATKAYVQTLAEGLRVELAPYGVDVVASAPGPIHTGFAERANMQMSMALKPTSVAQATLEALGRRTTVRPGWLSKLLEASLALLPRWARVRILAMVMKGMTKHQIASAA